MSSKAMRERRIKLVGIALAIGLMLGSPAVAIAVRAVSPEARWVGLLSPLGVVAVLALLAGYVVLGRYERLRKAQRSRATRPGDLEKEFRWGAWGFGAMALGVAATTALIEGHVAVAFLGLVAAWVLVSTHRPFRELDSRTAIRVRCSRETAFEFVTNPNNWPLYEPGLELIEPIVLPVAEGSVIRGRARRAGIVVDAELTITSYEPWRRFSTKILNAPGGSSGTYEFEPFDGGTTIAYRYHGWLTRSNAVLGGGLLRKTITNTMAAYRKQSMERLKDLLEARDATSV